MKKVEWQFFTMLNDTFPKVLIESVLRNKIGPVECGKTKNGP